MLLLRQKILLVFAEGTECSAAATKHFVADTRYLCRPIHGKNGFVTATKLGTTNIFFC